MYLGHLAKDTEAGALRGTLAYMSPEQVRGNLRGNPGPDGRPRFTFKHVPRRSPVTVAPKIGAIMAGRKGPAMRVRDGCSPRVLWAALTLPHRADNGR